jgi:hypothetical protein
MMSEPGLDRVQPSLRDFGPAKPPPALKRRAIFGSSPRDEVAVRWRWTRSGRGVRLGKLTGNRLNPTQKRGIRSV